ncbi:hypothetical protein HanXRQr2_Chr14g0659851 [Helianthus annuus]|uniref:Uncharacterized protein n=1 Tax=Helianthus annuus TaxID=4232 RepID=A0A9K3EC80_HELAN|nr:hypothetical protein HanXRQr2_Chr14g0659851 [Helianthus annuus]KAJ0841658.1 hypothetical protein HanPSC8_Chr14g0632921 [Helianthus annuus]
MSNTVAASPFWILCWPVLMQSKVVVVLIGGMSILAGHKLLSNLQSSYCTVNAADLVQHGLWVTIYHH